jgi:inorganic pyrophosphatase
MLKMADESGQDEKILAVPIDKLCALYRHARSYTDMPALLIAQIAHFFEHYKDLEPGKWVKLEGWADADEAKREIIAGVERFRTVKDKPFF